MDFFDVVTTQRAIRRLKPDPIPGALLRQILDAAICAPSGGNRQGWSFLVIRDAARRKRLSELDPEASGQLMKVPYYPGAAEVLGAPSDGETAALPPRGSPLGKFGRPPRRPLREVAFGERWAQAF